ncbi:MAG: DNA polymerase IV [Selenomonadales bacterium]|nr:DNA polymerase IV [Selenomonadales bacterium]
MMGLIMHVDMDAFYASIEQRDDSSLRGKPVIVGGTGARGVVATASYEARRYGVGSAMAMSKARQLCPNGIFIDGNHAHYEAVSAQLMEILGSFSPMVEPLSLDEAFLDISGLSRHHASPEEMGRAVKRRIFEELELVASVGIAPNKFLAKLASDLEKPDGLVIIREENVREVIRPLSVKRLWGVGKFTASQLAGLGITTIGDVADAPVEHLAKVLGKQAYTLKELADGIDKRKVEPVRKVQSVGNEETFATDIWQRDDIEKELLRLSEKVGGRLRRKGLFALTVTLKVRFASFSTVTRSVTLKEATQYDEVLYRTACELYGKVCSDEPIRLLGITASHLTETEEVSLFESESDKKKKTLYRTVDALKARFGSAIITKANLIDTKEEHHDK